MRWLRALLVVVVLLAMPAVAFAGHVEPTGATGPQYLVGTDHYGKVTLTVTYDKSVPTVSDVVYATACHPKGVSVPGTFKGTKTGTVAGANAGYAFSGVVRSGATVTAQGAIAAVAACKGSTAPLIFSATTAS